MHGCICRPSRQPQRAKRTGYVGKNRHQAPLDGMLGSLQLYASAVDARQAFLLSKASTYHHHAPTTEDDAAGQPAWDTTSTTGAGDDAEPVVTGAAVNAASAGEQSRLDLSAEQQTSADLDQDLQDEVLKNEAVLGQLREEIASKEAKIERLREAAASTVAVLNLTDHESARI